MADTNIPTADADSMLFTTECNAGHTVVKRMPKQRPFINTGGVWVRCNDCGTATWATSTMQEGR